MLDPHLSDPNYACKNSMCMQWETSEVHARETSLCNKKNLFIKKNIKAINQTRSSKKHTLHRNNSRLGERTTALIALSYTTKLLRQATRIYADMPMYVLGVWPNCRHCCRAGAGLLCYASTIQKHGDSHLQVVVACFKHMFSHAFTGTCKAKKIYIEAFFMKCSDQKRWEQLTSKLLF